MTKNFLTRTPRMSYISFFVQPSGTNMRLYYSLSCLVAFCAILSSRSALAQNTNCDTSISTQEEIDNFQCNSISRLYIVGSNISNLDGLSELNVIDGDLTIVENDILQNVDGLSGLASVGGSINFSNLSALTDVDGLYSLASVGDFLQIFNSEDLADLDGLSGLNSVGGDLFILVNDALADIDGLSGLTSVGGYIQIRENRALASVNGLSGLSSAPGGIGILSNDVLANLEGLSGITSIGGSLFIRSNSTLENVNELAGVNHVDGAIIIAENDVLANVDGLRNVAYVGGDFDIGLLIEFNPLLARCAIGFGPVLAADQSNPTTIGEPNRLQGNGSDLPNGVADSDCNSEADILAAYEETQVGISDHSMAEERLYVYPNPVVERATLAFALALPTEVTLAVYDALGREVAHMVSEEAAGDVEVPFNAFGLPAGVYLARLTAGDRTETVRLTVTR